MAEVEKDAFNGDDTTKTCTEKQRERDQATRNNEAPFFIVTERLTTQGRNTRQSPSAI